jgi:quinol-cytochrome oxidoreductase complex cytochrome b subunit
MFVVGAFMLAYNGHSRPEWWAGKAAALAAVCIALFPTTCDTCEPGLVSTVHYVAAVILFSILAYFCLGPFRKDTKGQAGKKGRRSKIYFVCGWTIILCMVVAALLKAVLPNHLADAIQVTYWAELVALVAFGIAWIVASKVIPQLADDKEALHLFTAR